MYCVEGNYEAILKLEFPEGCVGGGGGEGGRDGSNQKPCVGGVWILSGTVHYQKYCHV